MRAWRREHTGTLGLVPTMGYLHEGHLSLVRAARADNELAVATIFVNPTQFGPGEDFERYPRDEERDLQLLTDEGVNAVYFPSADSMYGPGHQTSVVVSEVTKRLEGERRPTHFEGVTTVVLKLFNATLPDRAYFGRKDAQQLRVIRRMVRDLDLGLEIVGCDIVREPDGLAMSSRNVYLTPAQRKQAPGIKAGLTVAAEAFSSGELASDSIRSIVSRRLTGLDLGEVDYISLADDETLEEISGDVERPALLSVVVKFGPTRLLDNIELVP